MTVSADRPDDAAEWDGAVAASDDTWLFHVAGIAPVFMERPDDRLHYLACREGDRLIGGAVLVFRQRRWRGLVSRRFADNYVGPYAVAPFVARGFHPDAEERIRDAILDATAEYASACGCESLVLWDTISSSYCLDRRAPVNRYVASPEWRHEERYYYVIDLTRSMDDLWRRLESRCRTGIRRAREALAVESGQERASARDDFIALIQGMHSQRGIAPAPRVGLGEIWGAVYDGARGEAFFCMEQGGPCAVAGIARHGDFACYMHAARSLRAPTGAAALAVWNGIDWAKRQGCRWIDFNGAVLERRGMEQQAAISHFKRGFGPELAVVHGGSRQLRPLASATYAFVDALGGSLKRLATRRQGDGKRSDGHVAGGAPAPVDEA